MALARITLILGAAFAAGCGGGGGGGSNGGGTTNTPPVARVDATPESGAAPLQVSLDGSASSDSDGSIQSFRWDFGDGSGEATGQTVDHTFGAVGTYQVRLTVTDDDGATGTSTVTVTVNAVDGEAPVAMAAATPENGVAPLTVDFSSAGSSDPDGSIVDYRWNFDDGSAVSFSPNPQHTFQAGSYDVTLTVIDDDGLTGTATVTILVSPPSNQLPQPAFTLSDESGPAPLAVDFDASGSSDPDGNIVSYLWDFGDGDTGSGATISHTFTDPGSFDVTLTVADDQSGVATLTRTVSVGQVPTAAATATPDSGGPSLLVTFDASASSDSDGSVAFYHWDFDDGDTPTVADPEIQHTFEDVGVYQVELRVEDDDGLLSDPVVIEVTVLDPGSLSLRDFFDTDSRSEYDYTTGSGQSVTHVTSADPDYGDYLNVVAGTGQLEISRDLPAQSEAYFQIHFWPQQANVANASFSVYLEENDTTYYLVQGLESVGAGESGAFIRKVVNGVTVDEAEFPAKTLMGNPLGYTNGLRYSINVYFSPERMTTEFTELRPRAVSMSTDVTPIQVARMRLVFDGQNARIDNIIEEPIEPDQLDYYVAFGDSITEGTGDGDNTDGRGFPIELQRRLLDERVTTQAVYNEGFGGYRVLDAMNEVGSLLNRHPQASVVLVMIGTNDALQQATTIGPTTYRTRLQSIIDDIRDAGKLPLIAKMPAEGPNQAQRDQMSAYNAQIDLLLAEPENADIFVEPPDFECYFNANPALINADLTHPSEEGYRNMAALWQKMIGLGALGTPADACSL